MELRHLRYLVAVAEELHFGRAAIRLNISQPPLSLQIQQLEKELDVRLFERTKREVRLTEAGKRIVNEARQVLTRVDHFLRVAAQAGSGEIGHLSVGIPGNVSQSLIGTLKKLGEEYPGVRVELHYMNTGLQIDALREGRIEVGFLNLPVQEPALTLERISRELLWLALPKGHRLARLPRVPLAAIAEEEMILFPRRVTPGLHDLITGMFRAAGLTLNVVHEVDSIIGSMTLVSANLGVAFCTPDVKRLWPNLVFRPIEGTPYVEQAVAYLHEAQTPVLEVFLNALRQSIRKQKALAD